MNDSLQTLQIWEGLVQQKKQELENAFSEGRPYEIINRIHLEFQLIRTEWQRSLYLAQEKRINEQPRPRKKKSPETAA